MEWIKYNKEDIDTYPRWGGNWDDASERVLVHYKSGIWKYDSYKTGYTDWDGENHYWNIDGEKGIFEVVSWAYFDRDNK